MHAQTLSLYWPADPDKTNYIFFDPKSQMPQEPTSEASNFFVGVRPTENKTGNKLEQKLGTFFVCYSRFLLFLFLYNDPFLLLIEALSILELTTMGPIPGLDLGSDAWTNN